jgi:hypothetical protein
MNSAPPLFALLLGLISRFNESEAILRLLSCLAGVAAFPSIYFLSKKFVPQNAAYFSTVLFIEEHKISLLRMSTNGGNPEQHKYELNLHFDNTRTEAQNRRTNGARSKMSLRGRDRVHQFQFGPRCFLINALRDLHRRPLIQWTKGWHYVKQ